MAKRSSINARSKKAEQKVVRYICDDDQALRSWKEDFDLAVIGECNVRWTIEVKNWEFPAGPAGVWTLLSNALDQAETYGNPACCAVLIPPRCQPKDALVMETDPLQGIRIVMPLSAFKAKYGPFTAVERKTA